MFIRSQNKAVLVNVNNSRGLILDGIYERKVTVAYDDTCPSIGEYSTKEKALKVLDDIEVAMRMGISVFQMPQDNEVKI